MTKRPTDRAGSQQWAQDVADLCHQAELVAAQSTSNIRYHHDRVNDDKKAKEAILNDYARLQKIEENCFGGRRVIPRLGGGTEGGDLLRQSPTGSPNTNLHLHNHQHDSTCGKHCTKEHHLPQLPLSARGVQAAKYRLRERAEQKKFKEEQVLLAREAEKRLRKERLKEAKSLFRDNGHVTNVLLAERMFESGAKSGEGGATSNTPRQASIDAGDPQGQQQPLVASSQHQKQLIITATLLATSGLPPDILKTGAAAIKNLVAGAQILLLSRQSVCMTLESRVAPLLAKLYRCSETRNRYVPGAEGAYQDPVENSLATAIQSILEDQAKLVHQKVELEDLVAYVDGLRKTIAARLPSFGSETDVTSPPPSTNLINTPQLPLPQVTAEQSQPPTTLNLVALAKGKRRRIPLQDTQAAIIAAGHAYQEAIAESDAAHSTVRSVKRDLNSRLAVAAASLSGKVRDNRALQRLIVAQIERLEQQICSLDDFMAATIKEAPSAAALGVSNPSVQSSPALNTTSGTTSAAQQQKVGPKSPVARGAGVVIPSATTALKHIQEDKAKVMAVLDQLKRNLNDKKALEVVDVEVLKVLTEESEKGSGPRPAGHTTNKSADARASLGKEIEQQLRGGGQSPTQPRSVRSQSDVYDGASSGRGSSSRSLAETNNSSSKTSQQAPSSGRRAIPPPTPHPARHYTGGAPHYETQHADVDDLISGRGSVSTRSAKVTKEHRIPAPPLKRN